MSKPSDLYPGHAAFLILKTLSSSSARLGDRQADRQVSREALQITQGSLYPVLHRLEHQGWVKASAALTEPPRSAYSFRLRPRGGNSWRASWRPGSGCRPRSGWWCARPNSATPSGTRKELGMRRWNPSAPGCAAGAHAGRIPIGCGRKSIPMSTSRPPKNIAAGTRPDEARATALRAFGPVWVHRGRVPRRAPRRVPEPGAGPPLHAAVAARQPLLLLTAVLSIAVAVSANATIFSLANALLLAEPTASRPDQLVHIQMESGSHVGTPSGATSTRTARSRASPATRLKSRSTGRGAIDP